MGGGRGDSVPVGVAGKVPRQGSGACRKEDAVVRAAVPDRSGSRDELRGVGWAVLLVVGQTPWSARVPLDPSAPMAGQGAGRGRGRPPHIAASRKQVCGAAASTGAGPLPYGRGSEASARISGLRRRESGEWRKRS